MTLSSITKIQRKPTYDAKTGRRYEYHVIAIPRAISEDSQYPFSIGEKVRITVDPVKKRMIIVKFSKRKARRKGR